MRATEALDCKKRIIEGTPTKERIKCYSHLSQYDIAEIKELVRREEVVNRKKSC